ncbi:DeoR/GlpR family DNA-binding transcription regulator [Kovacikia minuta CCNUW1]|uniref:DeoR/GlpR family DNA-binding transcription regulator n=1 Tax=Kovacikia minuta TaxID=2931930 RepID=UPI001CC9A725|nr:DeoR/GlpR family DNA-binding transcription regulator [Kovacikia minuta]UBF27616.1 DeoR/GlpR family DNA-binding transcription regulator [Kovacikia minuta CCNUW1]
MLTAERRQFILETLRRDGKVLSSQLSADLHVSEDTIRRDLRDLADSGLLQRVHGGALPKSPTAYSYTTRQNQAPQAKEAVAKAAAKLIQPKQVVILDSGTTTFLVAQHLPPDLEATIITNSPPIATVLSNYAHIDVLVLGGRLNKELRVAVGAATIEALQMFRADLCLLGIAGLHPELGITVYDLEEAHVKRAMVARAAEVAALASSEKLGTAAPYVIGQIGELTHLVTEATVDPRILAPYQAAGLTIVQNS